MPIEFAASNVSFGLVDDIDPPYLVVQFTGAAGANYLQFQRQQPQADDEDWGLYVEVNDPAFSGYECVARCDLSAGEIAVRLIDPLGPGDEVDGVVVTLDGVTIPPALVDCMRAVFAGREDRLRFARR